jgi:hypothetical protein
MNAIRFSILLIAVALISANCFGDSVSNWATNQLGGIENATIIASPTSVKAWRTIGSLASPFSESFSPEDFYRKSGKGEIISTNLAAQLSKILLDENSYPHSEGSLPTPGKDCFPEPGVVITFSNGKKDVNIFFCFECAILIVNPDEKTPNGLQTDFDPSRQKLLQIAKKIFPKDSKLQSFNVPE